MFTTDAHCDTLYNIVVHNYAPGDCTVTPERLKAGNIGIQTFAMFTSLRRPDPYADGMVMKELYKKLPLPRLDGKLPDAPPVESSAVFSCEGGEAFKGSIDVLREFDDDVHMRLIALTWNYENEIGMPAKLDATTGLKPTGFEFLREMDARGIAADVSHLNEAGFWDVVEKAQVAPLASHSNCRWLCDHFRNLTREQVRALIDRKGFIGINFYSDFLASGREAVLDDVLRHIDAICEMGGEDIIGFGSDFDGIDVWPEGLSNPVDFPALIELLRDHGYNQTQLEKIAGLNYWNFLKKAEESAR
ncbi:MAG: membrane dipeptidase [Clostridia bacterium]|nr:membrane dipeptidase [Clostridia bacterium]